MPVTCRGIFHVTAPPPPRPVRIMMITNIRAKAPAVKKLWAKLLNQDMKGIEKGQ